MAYLINGIFLHSPSTLKTMATASSCEEQWCGWWLRSGCLNLNERIHTDSNIHDSLFWRFFCCHFVCFKYHPSWLLDRDAGITAKEKLTIILTLKMVFTKQHKKSYMYPWGSWKVLGETRQSPASTSGPGCWAKFYKGDIWDLNKG